jgi:hypothetical protein
MSREKKRLKQKYFKKKRGQDNQDRKVRITKENKKQNPDIRTRRKKVLLKTVT